MNPVFARALPARRQRLPGGLCLLGIAERNTRRFDRSVTASIFPASLLAPPARPRAPSAFCPSVLMRARERANAPIYEM